MTRAMTKLAENSAHSDSLPYTERSLRTTAVERMDIHFISSLTPDDEDRLAPVLLEALKPMLELMPIAYTVRIRTSSNTLYQHTRTELAATAAPDQNGLHAPS